MKRFALFLLAALAPLAVHAATPSTSAVVNWSAPTLNTDGTTISSALTYNVYQGAAGAESQVASGLTAPTYTTTSGLTAGSSVCFQITAVVNGQESARTLEACATVPFSTPAAPTQVTVTIK